MTFDIVVLLGSGRSNGNSEAAAMALIKPLQDSGSSVKVFRLAEMEINHCRGCNACANNGGSCIIQDDMTQLYPFLEEADLVLLVTPIYFSGPSSVLKQVIDRCQCMWVRTRKGKENRYGALLTVSGQENANFQNTRSIVRSFLNTLSVGWGGDISFSGYDEPDELGSDPDALERARAFGLELLESIKARSGPGMDGRSIG
jgi:multimeric flavodoxin WrbA